MDKTWLENELRVLQFNSKFLSVMQIFFLLAVLVSVFTFFTPGGNWVLALVLALVANVGNWFFDFYKRWQKYKVKEFEERLAQLNSTNQKTEYESPEGKLYS